MFGLIGKIVATPGNGSTLAELLLEGSQNMPGNLAYIVALDAEDEDIIWVSEVWEDQASHQASLALPGVQEAIRRARPLIQAFAASTQTKPLGGTGLG